ncbi:MAG TPA: adenylosuccinate synthase [Blastocatellia bacterium]|nr:adenylosuccinate synthase [Blastocatellia bacterium]
MNLAIIGAQWGDEGKGKIVDLLAPHFDIITRYQGGHNAGHTVIIRRGEVDHKFVLHLIPSGVTHPGKTCVIGNGVVVDPQALLNEIDGLCAQGVEVNHRNLLISNRAHLILPYHVALDRAIEASRGGAAVGTTMRGIGPAYEDKMARRGLRAGDLTDPATLTEKLSHNAKQANRLIAMLNGDLIDEKRLIDDGQRWCELVAPHITDTTYFLNRAAREGRSLLLEGAQATMLDIDHGTYPFVTSSNSSAGGACTGAGIPPSMINCAIGVIKAYTTRVGGGPFPTELDDAVGEHIRARGGEYGASTGRPRRTGWFDAVVARYAVMVNGLDALALTKLDVLDDLDEIKICVGYRINGRETDQVPYDANQMSEAEPIYETAPGWREKTVGVSKFEDLPEKARKYVARLAELSGASFAIISTGAERNETIIEAEALDKCGLKLAV